MPDIFVASDGAIFNFPEIYNNIYRERSSPFSIYGRPVFNTYRKKQADMSKFLHRYDSVPQNTDFVTDLYTGKIISVKFKKLDNNIHYRFVTLNKDLAPKIITEYENINANNLCRVWDINNQKIISFYLQNVLKWSVAE